MPPEIIWTHQGEKDLGSVDSNARRRIEDALNLLALRGRGDLKRLRARPDQWRLRIGDHRVRLIYDLPQGTILVLRVLPRGRAYDRD